MQRRGLMRGSGRKGYYNVIGKDPLVHRQSAMGIKQMQRVQDLPIGKSVRSSVTGARGRIITKQPFAVQYRHKGREHVKFTDPKYWKGGKYQPKAPSFHVLSKKDKDEIGQKVAMSGLRGMKALEYAEKLARDKIKQKGGKDMPVVEVDEFLAKAEHNEGILSKIGSGVGKATEWVKKEIPVVTKGVSDAITDFQKGRAEKKASEKAESLKSSKYGGLSDKYLSQKERVSSLKQQIADRQETGRDYSDLLKELETEENQYREIQEKLTDVSTQNFSDSELRQLAISYKDESLLGFGDNIYEQELIRRIGKRKQLDLKIKQAEAKPAESSGGLFDF